LVFYLFLVSFHFHFGSHSFSDKIKNKFKFGNLLFHFLHFAFCLISKNFVEELCSKLRCFNRYYRFIQN
jgi:hypothetical protein